MKPIVSERENLVFRDVRARCENRNVTMCQSKHPLQAQACSPRAPYDRLQLCKKFLLKANSNGTRRQVATPTRGHIQNTLSN